MKKTIMFGDNLYNFHNFEKKNLISNKDGSDTYHCLDCGISGKRHFLEGEIHLSRVSKKKLENCNGTKGEFELIGKQKQDVDFLSKKVKIIVDAHLGAFDARVGDVLEIVKCPDNEDITLEGVWVVNETCKEPFRLLPYEYELIKEFEDEK